MPVYTIEVIQFRNICAKNLFIFNGSDVVQELTLSDFKYSLHSTSHIYTLISTGIISQ